MAAQPENNLEYRLRQIEEKATKHHRDLYEGNGKASLTTRMDIMEKAIEQMLEKQLWLFRISVATLLTVVGGIFIGIALRWK